MSLIIVAQSNYLVSQSLTTTEGSYITDDYTNNAKEFDCPTFDIILKFAMLRSPTLMMRYIAVGATLSHRSPPVGVIPKQIIYLLYVVMLP